MTLVLNVSSCTNFEGQRPESPAPYHTFGYSVINLEYYNTGSQLWFRTRVVEVKGRPNFSLYTHIYISVNLFSRLRVSLITFVCVFKNSKKKKGSRVKKNLLFFLHSWVDSRLKKGVELSFSSSYNDRGFKFMVLWFYCEVIHLFTNFYKKPTFQKKRQVGK